MYVISMDPRRLLQVHRIARRWGLPLQYSVFLIPGKPARISALLGELADLIEPKLDDIRIYPLPAKVEIVQLGRGSTQGELAPFSALDPKHPLGALILSGDLDEDAVLRHAPKPARRRRVENRASRPISHHERAIRSSAAASLTERRNH